MLPLMRNDMETPWSRGKLFPLLDFYKELVDV